MLIDQNTSITALELAHKYIVQVMTTFTYASISSDLCLVSLMCDCIISMHQFHTKMKYIGSSDYKTYITNFVLFHIKLFQTFLYICSRKRNFFLSWNQKNITPSPIYIYIHQINSYIIIYIHLIHYFLLKLFLLHSDQYLI